MFDTKQASTRRTFLASTSAAAASASPGWPAFAAA